MQRLLKNELTPIGFTISLVSEPVLMALACTIYINGIQINDDASATLFFMALCLTTVPGNLNFP